MKCVHLWVFYNKTIWGNRRTASEALSSILSTSSSPWHPNHHQDQETEWQKCGRHWYQNKSMSVQITQFQSEALKAQHKSSHKKLGMRTWFSKRYYPGKKYKLEEKKLKKGFKIFKNSQHATLGLLLQRLQDPIKWSQCSKKLVSLLFYSKKSPFVKTPLPKQPPLPLTSTSLPPELQHWSLWLQPGRSQRRAWVSGNAKNDEKGEKWWKDSVCRGEHGWVERNYSNSKKNTKIKEWVQNGGRTVFYRVVIAF